MSIYRLIAKNYIRVRAVLQNVLFNSLWSAQRHQAISWTNVDFSVGICGTHLRPISHEVLNVSFNETNDN